MMTTHRTIGAALVVLTSSLAAQTPSNCATRLGYAARPDRPLIVVDGKIMTDPGEFTAYTGGRFVSRGPGAAFGITSYNCATCEDKIKQGSRSEFNFFTEPVVLSVTAATTVKVGDVIEAVNEQPITSSAGSTQFTYPTAGANTLTVRRGREHVVLRFDLPVLPPCADSTADVQSQLRRLDAAAAQLRGRPAVAAGVDTVRVGQTRSSQGSDCLIKLPAPPGPPVNEPLYVIDGVTYPGAHAAQQGPGELFGVALFNCASCAIKRGGEVEYDFGVEPVVLAVTKATSIKPGDVIEAVNNQPITTPAGSRHFSYPPDGENTVTVHRGQDRLVLRFVLPIPAPACRDSTGDHVFRVMGRRTGSVEFRPPFASEHIQGRLSGKSDSAAQTLYRVQEVFMQSPPPATRFGFAVWCNPSCVEVRAADGTSYNKYERTPQITAIRDGSPAAAVGLQVGDLITRVDGLSILEQEGAVTLSHSEQKESLRLTVLRDGKEIEFLLAPGWKPSLGVSPRRP